MNTTGKRPIREGASLPLPRGPAPMKQTTGPSRPYPVNVDSDDPPATAVAAPRWLSDEEQAIWRALLSVEARLNERLDRELRDAHGLSTAEYAVLVHLGEGDPDGTRMSELAERLLLSRSGLTRRIDGMVRSGLVTRRSCPFDGRGLMAALTDKGRRRLAEAAPTHVAGVRRYLIDTLGDDLSRLARALARIDAALDAGRPDDARTGPCPVGGDRTGRGPTGGATD